MNAPHPHTMTLTEGAARADLALSVAEFEELIETGAVPAPLINERFERYWVGDDVALAMAGLLQLKRARTASCKAIDSARPSHPHRKEPRP